MISKINTSSARYFRKNLLIMFILVLLHGILDAQYSTNSLYSLYGLGDLESATFGKLSGMGKAGVALKSDGFINNLNPASLTEFGTNSFIFDVGLTGYYSTFESQGAREIASDMNFSHLALGFPITKWWGISAGLIPFSSVGYDISTTTVFEGSELEFETEFIGSGEINQFYFSNSFRIMKNLSLGFNLSYLMGSIVQKEISKMDIVDFYNLNTIKTNYFNNLYLILGLQYNKQFNSDNLSIGLTYNPRQELLTSYSHEILIPDVSSTLYSKINAQESFIIPGALTVGLAYDINSKYKLVIDYRLQKWSDVSYSVAAARLIDSYSYNFGIEYTPEKQNISDFLKSLEYRIGAYYENTYLLLRGNQIKNYGLTLGVGIPVMKQKSKIQLSMELGQLGTLNDGLIKENYAAFKLEFTLHDNWFVRRMID
jgi:hypothetical protein